MGAEDRTASPAGKAEAGGLKSPGRQPTAAFFDDDRPQYHVQPPAGWMNDPNGPIYYKGRYHMFYQYLPEKCEWDFGIVWGHAYSEDLVHWEHLEPALVPSPGWLDADGCFSGCCVLGENGRPVILYTGVRLRSNHETGPLPPSDQDLGMVFIESQCAAVPADDSDELLIKWDKLQVPFLKLPPKSERYCLTGWRDPFILYDLDGRVVDQDAFNYHMLIGSGIKDKGGTALVYGSKRLEDGWELLGLLCEGNHAEDDTGIVWECPLVVRLSERCENTSFQLDVSMTTTQSTRRAPSWLWQRAENPAKTSAQRLSSADLVLEAGGFGAGVGKAVSRQKSNLGPLGSSQQKTSMPMTTHSMASHKQPGFSVIPGSIASNASHALHASNASSSSSLASVGAPAPKKNPSISLLAQKLEQVAIHSENDNNGNNGVNNDDKDDSSSEAPSIASRVNSARPDGIEDGVDSFEALKAKVKPLNVSRPIAEEAESEGCHVRGSLIDADANPGSVTETTFKETDWHLFTVSPDAPTNPVLYWIGHMLEKSASRCPKFDIANARGPFKLDLGDILYAPNVCQDGRGRWLLWGWLQERRKVGSYAYAGCLTLPRVLHVTSEGRLIQSPVPEVDKLRAKERKFSVQRVALQPEMTYPIKYVRSERLDIQCSIERGASTAAGLLFRSHEAEADGSTAIIYDWSTNKLEAIFNVPPNWKPHVGVGTADHAGPAGPAVDKPRRDSEDSNLSCDPAAMLSRTPRRTSFSMEHSMFDSLMSESGRGSPDSTTVGSPSLGPGSPQSCSDSEFLTNLSNLHGMASPSPQLPASTSLVRSGSSMAMAMQRSTSVTNLATGAISMGTSFLGASASMGGNQLSRGLSMSREGAQAAHPVGAGMMGTSANALVGSLTDFMRSTPSMLNLADMDDGAGIDDEDLGTLLEDLAAPMRPDEEEVAGGPAHIEPRRVGGALAMNSTQTLHLRIFVDHSSIEVFTGTGECLCTRIYRGRGPNPNNPVRSTC